MKQAVKSWPCWCMRVLATTLLISALVACGGGGGDAPAAGVPSGPGPVSPTVPPVPTPPTAPTSPGSTQDGLVVTMSAAKATPLAASELVLSLEGTTGEPVSGGTSHAYRLSDLRLQLVEQPEALIVIARATPAWYGVFRWPQQAGQLKPGLYKAVAGADDVDASKLRFSWMSESFQCRKSVSELNIQTATYEGGMLTALDLSFEQYCDGAQVPLRGRLQMGRSVISMLRIPVNPVPADPVVSLSSDARDYIGGGKVFAYDHGNARIQAQGRGTLFNIKIDGDDWWVGDFELPSASGRIAPGTYRNLTRHPFNLAGSPGMSWIGNGRGCNTVTGEVQVHAARYEGEKLVGIDLSFEHFCEGGVYPLRGRIRWEDRPAHFNQPGAMPDHLWAPPSSEFAQPGNLVYVDGDWGDYVSGSQTFWIKPAKGGSSGGGGNSTGGAPLGQGRISLTEEGGELKFLIEGNFPILASFKAMDGITRLQRGYYGMVKRFPFHNPQRGGMSWIQQGRGCNTLGGWFMVDDIQYRGDKLSLIDMRFAQHCEGVAAALRGRIRWSLD